MSIGGLARRLRGDEGGVIVLVGLLLPFLVGLTALVIEVGSWTTHRRHLQTQVDAAALAGGALFSACVQDPGGARAAMEAEASRYAGGTWNPQLGGTAGGGTLTFGFQSSTFAAGSQPADDTPPGSPCDTGTFDVKGTERDIPSIFAASPLATVRAHARVELKRVESMTGLLPIAVPDTRLSAVVAIFVDEATGTPPLGCPGSCSIELQRAGTSGSLQLWSSPAPLAVPVTGSSIGVRIRVVGHGPVSAPCGSLYVECYDSGTGGGVVHIRGYDPTATAPAVRNAWLLPGTCLPDAAFANGPCSAGIQAEVDLGPSHPLSGSGASATVTAAVGSGPAIELQPAAGATTGLVSWSAASGLALPDGGPHPVSLAWSWRTTSGTYAGKACTLAKPCTASGSLGTVQRAFVATADRSGPLRSVQVGEAGVSTAGATSFPRGSTRSLTVSVAALGSLTTQAAASDPVVLLRVTGSQNQSIDCDPAISNIADELAAGCTPSYGLSDSSPCPAYNDLWSLPQPWSCVKTQTGGAVGQVERGLETRILRGAKTCTAPISWPAFAAGDPRLVPLIVTPFGTFGGSGNDVVPVIDLGAFYITGWNGDPCSGATPVPKGYIAGHFVKHIAPGLRGQGAVTCTLDDPTQITPCVPVMTR